MMLFYTLFQWENTFWFLFDCLDRVSYHASDEGHWAGALPAGVEHTASGQIPVEGHVCDSFFPDEISGAGSMYSGLKIMRVASPSKSSKHGFCP